MARKFLSIFLIFLSLSLFGKETQEELDKWMVGALVSTQPEELERGKRLEEILIDMYYLSREQQIYVINHLIENSWNPADKSNYEANRNNRFTLISIVRRAFFPETLEVVLSMFATENEDAGFYTILFMEIQKHCLVYRDDAKKHFSSIAALALANQEVSWMWKKDFFNSIYEDLVSADDIPILFKIIEEYLVHLNEEGKNWGLEMKTSELSIVEKILGYIETQIEAFDIGEDYQVKLEEYKTQFNELDLFAISS